MSRPAFRRRATSSLAATVALARGVTAGPASALINTSGSNSSQLSSPNPQPTSAHASSPSDGFDWDDAGIGAAGVFVLSTLILGGALAVSHRHTHLIVGPAAGAEPSSPPRASQPTLQPSEAQ